MKLSHLSSSLVALKVWVISTKYCISCVLLHSFMFAFMVKMGGIAMFRAINGVLAYLKVKEFKWCMLGPIMVLKVNGDEVEA